MNIDDSQIVAFRAKVKAAQEEFDQATAYHEAWKPAAYDAAVHAQMGTSFASTTVSIIRQALRREMLLVLARLWDTNPKAVCLTTITNSLNNGQIVDVLANERAGQWGNEPLHFPAAPLMNSSESSCRCRERVKGNTGKLKPSGCGSRPRRPSRASVSSREVERGTVQSSMFSSFGTSTLRIGR